MENRFEGTRELTPLEKQKSSHTVSYPGCQVLFKSGSGIIICGEARVDGNNFLCKRCLKENKGVTEDDK